MTNTQNLVSNDDVVVIDIDGNRLEVQGGVVRINELGITFTKLTSGKHCWLPMGRVHSITTTGELVAS